MTLTPVEKVLWRLRDLLYAAPSPKTDLQSGLAGPIGLVGVYRAASGIGRATRSLADGLENAGAEILRLDLSAVFDQCELDNHPSYINDPQALARESARAKSLIIHLNAPETDRALLALRAFKGARRRPIIGVWVWETSQAPTSWANLSRRLTEIWTPSRFSAKAIEAGIGPDKSTPVKVVPHILTPPMISQDVGDDLMSDQRAALGFGEKTFVCLAMADGRSSFHRKNPLGAIQVFKEALPTDADAGLIIKTRRLDHYPPYAEALRKAAGGDPRIHFIDRNMPETDQWRLLSSIDVFLSLHRAEGFGLPIAEAMMLGKAVIATGWSGNMDFMENRGAIAVPYDLVNAQDLSGIYPEAQNAQWAEPDLTAAAVSLRDLFEAPQNRLALGKQAIAETGFLQDLDRYAFKLVEASFS